MTRPLKVEWAESQENFESLVARPFQASNWTLGLVCGMIVKGWEKGDGWLS
jgi:hypothetical protein